MVWVVEINNPKEFYPELFTNSPSNKVFCFLMDQFLSCCKIYWLRFKLLCFLVNSLRVLMGLERTYRKGNKEKQRAFISSNVDA